MASHQTGWSERSQLHLFINEGPGRGRHGSSVGDRAWLLVPSCHPKWGAEVMSDLPGRSPSAGALAQLPRTHGGWALPACPRWHIWDRVAGKTCREPCCFLHSVDGEIQGTVGESPIQPSHRVTPGSLLQLGQWVVACLLQWPWVRHLCLPQFSASKP